MNQLKKIPVTNNLTVKVVAIIFGYALWLTFSRHQPVAAEIEIPIYFFNQNKELKIDSPHNIRAKIKGLKKDIVLGSSGVHIDLQDYHQTGEYEIEIYPDNIFLLNNLNLINYYPSKIKIQIT